MRFVRNNIESVLRRHLYPTVFMVGFRSESHSTGRVNLLMFLPTFGIVIFD